MARILFIENRGKTAFWSVIAQDLARRGHDVSWLVQNPIYAPRGGHQIRMPFPGAADLQDIGIPDAVSTDRGRSYFEAGDQHYAHYISLIDRALDKVRPDVVVGEPTLFHELLTIAACRERSIPYLHPTMSRYPGGRFQILTADTQVPAVSSGETWPATQVTEIAEAISTGRSLPSYMAKPSAIAGQIRKLRRLKGLAQTTLGRIRGEKFNTPAPARKMALNRALTSDLAEWAKLERVPDADVAVLYPLQMQPEANIDVWGRPYSDQVQLIRDMLKALPDTGCVAVKANPKSKYEVSKALIALATTDPRVVLLPLSMKMDAAHACTIGAVTVSGTVGLEAVFGRGRCISMRHPVIETYFPEFHADTPDLAVEKLLRDPHIGKGDAQMGARLLAQLLSDSFEGTINEPLYDPTCVSAANVTKVASALDKAIAVKTKDAAK